MDALKEELLQQMDKEEGITFGDCVWYFGKKQPAKITAFVEKAKEEFHKEGELEIDDHAVVSWDPFEYEEGAYVMAWVWVSK